MILNAEFLNSVTSTTAKITIPSTGTSGNARTNAPAAGTYLNNQLYKEAVYNLIRASSDNMRIRRSEYVPSRHYFVRVKNRDFNYSNNPTFTYSTATTDAVTGEIRQRGDIKQSDFLTDPKVYPTSVGLYNSNNELVAVAKLSRPAQKTFSNELLIKVRLDF